MLQYVPAHFESELILGQLKVPIFLAFFHDHIHVVWSIAVAAHAQEAFRFRISAVGKVPGDAERTLLTRNGKRPASKLLRDEIRSGKDRFTGPRFHSGTVPFAYSVAIWKLGNPVVAYSCEDMSMSFVWVA